MRADQSLFRWVYSFRQMDAQTTSRGSTIEGTPLPICTTRELASHLARYTHELKHILQTILEKQLQQETATHPEPLGLYRTFVETLGTNLQPETFADQYAQTIAYGLFTARCIDSTETPAGHNTFTRTNAFSIIPTTHPFLKRLFEKLGAEDIEPELARAIDNIVCLLRHTDMQSILEDFGNRLTKEDPVVHFYEEFLQQYDPALRETRGVYYTPEPVVRFITRAVDHILHTAFEKPLGVADPNTLLIDPACGTGSFLYELVRHIHQRVSEVDGMSEWQKYVRTQLVQRLFGFEVLVAPFAVAHLKLTLQLQQLGYRFRKEEPLGIYLTNTLELTHRTDGLALNDSDSLESIVGGQHDATLVVLGNPPYSGHSANRSRDRRSLTWIGTLLEDYKRIDGQRIRERNSKWLQDDYVKFIRWAQAQIEHKGKGILAFITNHGYLDNPTFYGMRANLLKSFDCLYILNLHGNARRKETSPDGGTDENVFDIQQGTAILIAVKSGNDKDNSARVFYYDLWGRRETKYAFLESQTIESIDWVPLTPQPPTYLFLPQDISLRDEYEKGWYLPNIFPTHSVAIITARDSLTIHWTAESVWDTAQRFVALDPEQARTEFGLDKDSIDWSVVGAQEDLRQAGVPDESAKEYIRPVMYRPFDTRYTFYTAKARGFHTAPRARIMQQLLKGNNIGLVVGRYSAGSGDKEWSVAFVSRQIVDLHIFRRGGTRVYPLYLYNTTTAQNGLWSTSCYANISQGFLESFGYNTTPESVFAYIYAILYSTRYRKRYLEFLKHDSPRIPLPPNRATFEKLSALGQELIALHLLEHPDLQVPACQYPIEGKNKVIRVRYENEQVWINEKQFFAPVPRTAWAFRIGAHQVCHKWLADRKGRVLAAEDIFTYQRIVNALAKTSELQVAIDLVCEASWGW